VNIALGLLALDVCPGFDRNGDGRIAIAELTRSVADALYGCGVIPPPTRTPTRTPSPRPTNTRTNTPTVTNTFTPSPTATTAVDISGQWIESNVVVVSSSCPRAVTDLLKDELAGFSCSVDVSVAGNDVTAVDCDGEVTEGSVDARGVATFPLFASQTEERCTVTLVGEATVDLSSSPATAFTTLRVDLSGRCAFGDCGLEVESEWSRPN
jgi:hypothetical protein